MLMYYFLLVLSFFAALFVYSFYNYKDHWFREATLLVYLLRRKLLHFLAPKLLYLHKTGLGQLLQKILNQ
jgi:hypothetical protein